MMITGMQPWRTASYRGSQLCRTVGFQPSLAFSAVMRTAMTWPSVFEKGFAGEGLVTSTMYGMIGFIGESIVPSI